MEEGKKGKKQVETDEEVKRTSDKTYGKTVIMPIAVPGVGASTLPLLGVVGTN